MTTESQKIAKYVPKRKLRAIGSYYSVYEATQVGLNRAVELRVLNTKFQADSPELARFQLEFSTLATVDHPNIIRVLDLGVLADHVFYVTDLRDAKSFQELLDKGHPFTVEDVLMYGRALSNAIGHLHRRNILHRDLSASTVYLDQETNVPYIAEFSLIRNQNVQSLTQRGIPTLRMLARTPEALSGLVYDQRTDVYLLGVLLYRLLTGQEPTVARPGSQIDAGIRPRSVNPKIPTEVDQLVSTALKRNPEERFQSAEAFTAEIEKVAEKLDLKAALSEIAEATMTGLKVRLPPRQTPDMKSSRGLSIEPSRSSSSDLEAKKGSSGDVSIAPTKIRLRRTGPSIKVDPVLWIRAHKEYLYLAGAPVLLLVVLSVLIIARPEQSIEGPGTTTHSPGSHRTTGTAQRSSVEPLPARDYGPDVKKVSQAIKAMPTNKENFHQRWYLLDNWIKQLTAAQKAPPFTQSDLVSVRINFYRDEQEACTKLDILYEKASSVL